MNGKCPLYLSGRLHEAVLQSHNIWKSLFSNRTPRWEPTGRYEKPVLPPWNDVTDYFKVFQVVIRRFADNGFLGSQRRYYDVGILSSNIK
jgi:hypothetical protein